MGNLAPKMAETNKFSELLIFRFSIFMTKSETTKLKPQMNTNTLTSYPYRRAQERGRGRGEGGDSERRLWLER